MNELAKMSVTELASWCAATVFVSYLMIWLWQELMSGLAFALERLKQWLGER